VRKVIATLGLAASAVAFTKAPAELSGEDLMKALQGGGYTVVLRHARTDHSFQEAMGTVPAERYEQRNLSDEGVKDARLMGVVFKKYGIKFAEIVASPMFRTKETAEYAAGKPTQLTLALRAIPPTPEQGAILKAKPAPGTNRLIVTHHFVIEMGVPGIKPGDIGESEAAVVKPTADGGIELVGKIKLADWTTLAGPAANATTTAPAVTHGGGGNPADFITKGYVAGAPLPNTPAGHIAEAYLNAFSSGDTVLMKSAIESYLEIDPSRPTSTRLQNYTRLFEQFGPLKMTGLDNSDPSQLIIFAHAKGGALKLTIKPSATQHMRASSIAFSYMEAQRP
jgi:phosphohistidine phosphatase SixA